MATPQLIATNDAYSELSRPAFAVWSRLKELPLEALSSRRKTAHGIGYSVRRSNEILSELAGKGYIRLEPGANKFSPTRIIPVRPQKVSRPQEEKRPREEDCVDGHCCPDTKDNPLSEPAVIGKTESAPALATSSDPPDQNPSPRKQKSTTPKRVKHIGPAPCTDAVSEAGVDAVRRTLHPKDLKDPDLKDLDLKISLIVPEGLECSTQRVREKQQNPPRQKSKIRPRVDLDKMDRRHAEQQARRSRQHSEKIKAGQRRTRERGHTRTAVTAPLPSGDALARDLEQDAELPNASFSPGPEQRARMVEILSLEPRNRDRRQLVQRLGEQFRKIYTRYRRRWQPGYSCEPPQHRFAERAAALCVMLGVKPTDLIGYWAEHVADFTPMRYPSLAFLSSPGNVDAVACAHAPADGSKPEKAGKPCEIDSTHAYADTSRLDPRLRPGLLEAGFDLTGIDDRYLMTVQGAAQDILDFPDMFISGKMKPWVLWAAKHLYANIESLV